MSKIIIKRKRQLSKKLNQTLAIGNTQNKLSISEFPDLENPRSSKDIQTVISLNNKSLLDINSFTFDQNQIFNTKLSPNRKAFKQQNDKTLPSIGEPYLAGVQKVHFKERLEKLRVNKIKISNRISANQKNEQLYSTGKLIVYPIKNKRKQNYVISTKQKSSRRKTIQNNPQIGDIDQMQSSQFKNYPQKASINISPHSCHSTTAIGYNNLVLNQTKLKPITQKNATFRTPIKIKTKNFLNINMSNSKNNSKSPKQKSPQTEYKIEINKADEKISFSNKVKKQLVTRSQNFSKQKVKRSYSNKSDKSSRQSSHSKSRDNSQNNESVRTTAFLTVNSSRRQNVNQQQQKNLLHLSQSNNEVKFNYHKVDCQLLSVPKEEKFPNNVSRSSSNESSKATIQKVKVQKRKNTEEIHKNLDFLQQNYGNSFTSHSSGKKFIHIKKKLNQEKNSPSSKLENSLYRNSNNNSNVNISHRKNINSKDMNNSSKSTKKTFVPIKIQINASDNDTQINQLSLTSKQTQKQSYQKRNHQKQVSITRKKITKQEYVKDHEGEKRQQRKRNSIRSKSIQQQQYFYSSQNSFNTEHKSFESNSMQNESGSQNFNQSQDPIQVKEVSKESQPKSHRKLKLKNKKKKQQKCQNKFQDSNQFLTIQTQLISQEFKHVETDRLLKEDGQEYIEALKQKIESISQRQYSGRSKNKREITSKNLQYFLEEQLGKQDTNRQQTNRTDSSQRNLSVRTQELADKKFQDLQNGMQVINKKFNELEVSDKLQFVD